MYDYYEQHYPDGKVFYHLDIGTVSDEEYDKLKPIIEHLGGHWREKFKCFVFGEDVRDKIDYYMEHTQEHIKLYVICRNKSCSCNLFIVILIHNLT